MKKYIMKRIFTGLLSVVISFVITFFLVKTAPGNPIRLLTGKENPTNEDAAQFDLVPQITKQTPPAFIMATAEDFLTTFGALPLSQKYAQLGLPYELHVFNFGRHGLSLAGEPSAHGSTNYLDPSFSQWHGLSVLWIKRTLGQPQFVDKSNSKMAHYLKEQGIQIPGF